MKVYQVLIDYNEYIETVSNNVKINKSKRDINNNIRDLRKDYDKLSVEYMKRVDDLIEEFNIELSSLKEKDVNIIFKKVNDGVVLCQEINSKYMSDLITLTKLYESGRKNNSNLRLSGKQVLDFIQDDEKHEKFKIEFEKEQKEKLELYCPNIYKKDVDDKSENNKNSSK